MFMEFFLFELQLRLKSISTYVFFLLAGFLPFFSIGEGCAERTLGSAPYYDAGDVVRVDSDCGDFWARDSAGFSGGHVSACVYEAGLEVCVFGRALGRFDGDHDFRVLRDHFWAFSGNADALGGPSANCAE